MFKFVSKKTKKQKAADSPTPAYKMQNSDNKVTSNQRSTLASSSYSQYQYSGTSSSEIQANGVRGGSIMNSIKSKIQKSSKEEMFEVDIHYITERMIAMSFPPGGLDSAYKASLREVTKMLQTKHDDKYKIFNLSERRDDIPKLNKHYVDFGWPDHLAPPLESLCSICKAIDSWLSADPQNVAVLHCKGSTGRMGVVLASYMHYCSICASADNALDRFAMKRYYDQKLCPATHPSQRRYIQYFSGLLSGNIKMNNQPIYMHQVILHGIPNFDPKGGCRPFIKIYQGMQPVFTSGVYMPTGGHNSIVIAIEPTLQLRGDILIKCYHKRPRAVSRDVVFRLQFHTCAIDADRLMFEKRELDEACKDSRFLDGGRVEIVLSNTSDRSYIIRDHDSVPVDTNMDALVRQDSYENFNLQAEDGIDGLPPLENISHREGPVDGSLYAQVTKRKITSTVTVEDGINGPHASMDSGISSSSGHTGQSNLNAPTPPHNPSYQNNIGNPAPSNPGQHIYATPNKPVYATPGNPVQTSKPSNPSTVPHLQRPTKSPMHNLSAAQQNSLDELLNDMLESAGIDPLEHKAEAEAAHNRVYTVTTTTTISKEGPNQEEKETHTKLLLGSPKPQRKQITPIDSETTLISQSQRSMTESQRQMLESHHLSSERKETTTLTESQKPASTSPAYGGAPEGAASPPAPPRKYASLGYNIGYYNPDADRPHYRRLDGFPSSGRPQSPNDDEDMKPGGTGWLLQQKQKLRSRQEGYMIDEIQQRALVSELQEVQNRMTLRKQESEKIEKDILGDEPINEGPPTTHKPPIYQQPKSDTEPPKPRGWQSHQKPLTRQQSDSSYDRDRPLARPRAGSDSSPLSPPPEKYYQNIGSYSSPSKDRSPRDESSLLYKKKMDDEMQALLDGLQETARSASLPEPRKSAPRHQAPPVEVPVTTKPVQRPVESMPPPKPVTPSYAPSTKPVTVTPEQIQKADSRSMSQRYDYYNEFSCSKAQQQGLIDETPITATHVPGKKKPVSRSPIMGQPTPFRQAEEVPMGRAVAPKQETAPKDQRPIIEEPINRTVAPKKEAQKFREPPPETVPRDRKPIVEEPIGKDKKPPVEEPIGRDKRPPVEEPIGRDRKPPVEEPVGRDIVPRQEVPPQQQPTQPWVIHRTAMTKHERKIHHHGQQKHNEQYQSGQSYSPVRIEEIDQQRRPPDAAPPPPEPGVNDVIKMTANLEPERQQVMAQAERQKVMTHAERQQVMTQAERQQVMSQAERQQVMTQAQVHAPPRPTGPAEPARFPVTQATPYMNRRPIQQSTPLQQGTPDERAVTPAFPVTPGTPYMNRTSPAQQDTIHREVVTTKTRRVTHHGSESGQSNWQQQNEQRAGGIINTPSPRGPTSGYLTYSDRDRTASPMRGEGPPGGYASPGSVYYGTSRRSSTSSLDNIEVIRGHPVFVKDVSSYWYKPHISRENAINLLKDKPPGTFIVRDSNSFPGAFGLAVKVAQPPPNVQNKTGDISNELVRHFLIEPSSKGVRLKGCANEPVFGSLSALVYQHSTMPLALPCKLIIPEVDLTADTITESELPNTASALLQQGAACNVLYLATFDTESLTGPQAVKRAMLQLSQMGQTVPTIVHFKVSSQGITITDNMRKLFFRRHYPEHTVTFAGMDPEDRRWTQPSRDGGTPMNAKCFGFIARKHGTKADNACHLFAELDPDQPATAIVNFVSKVMIPHATIPTK